MDGKRSKKHKGALITKSQPDLFLWGKIQELVRRSELEKIEAVTLIFNNYSVVPREADDLLKEMVLPNNPVDIRRKIATDLVSKSRIPWGLHLDLLQTLRNDKDQEVARTIKPLWEPYEALEKSLRISIEKQNTILANLIPKNFFQGIAAKQLEITIPKGVFENIAQQVNAASTRFTSQLQDQIKRMAYFQLPQSYLDSLTNIKLANEGILRSISMVPTSYFPIERESVVIKPSENPLITKLKTIPSGQECWYQYQSMCKDILTFCFVPPLLDPMEESRTEGGLHRRDIIYPMSLGEGGFWGYLQISYSASHIIVDAKNYGDELPKDQVVITSKYFGAKKLGNFGLIISRRGPSKSAKKEQFDRWLHHDEMIICLSDADLEEMVALKQAGNEPEVVLSKLIRELRESV
ncbi:MAG: hypothetical protein KAV98_00935 [Dehalococcoidia bacterium]|nr:hypothetical protein [Dehalococcoidia bacterium]